MRHLVLAAFLISSLTLVATAAPADKPMIVTPTSVSWMTGPPEFPKGLKVAALHGDPGKSGSHYVLRFWMPSGYVVKPHMHPGDETLSVISGTLWMGYGKTMVASSMKAMPAGSFFYVPKGTWHYVKAQGPVVLEETGIGPAPGITFAK